MSQIYLARVKTFKIWGAQRLSRPFIRVGHSSYSDIILYIAGGLKNATAIMHAISWQIIKLISAYRIFF